MPCPSCDCKWVSGSMHWTVDRALSNRPYMNFINSSASGKCVVYRSLYLVRTFHKHSTHSPVHVLYGKVIITSSFSWKYGPTLPHASHCDMKEPRPSIAASKLLPVLKRKVSRLSTPSPMLIHRLGYVAGRAVSTRVWSQLDDESSVSPRVFSTLSSFSRSSLASLRVWVACLAWPGENLQCKLFTFKLRGIPGMIKSLKIRQLRSSQADSYMVQQGTHYPLGDCGCCICHRFEHNCPFVFTDLSPILPLFELTRTMWLLIITTMLCLAGNIYHHWFTRHMYIGSYHLVHYTTSTNSCMMPYGPSFEPARGLSGTGSRYRRTGLLRH